MAQAKVHYIPRRGVQTGSGSAEKKWAPHHEGGPAVVP